MELPYGSIKHFPAGTYDAQIATWAGRAELDAMSIVQQAWYAFGYLGASKWKKPELKLAAWMDKKPQPEPTRRLDGLIAQLWGVGWWVLLMWKGRDG